MHISLTPQLEAFIDEAVKSGRYPTASEAVRSALRLLQQTEAENESKLGSLRAAIAESDADIAAGRYTTITTAEEHDAFYAQILKGAKPRTKA
jgi:antitoxin ParD1/3/4